MSTEKKLSSSRRDCLKVMAAAAGGVAAGVGGARVIGRMGPPPAGPWHVLSESEARLVDLLTEQIIPADKFGGASEAGVVHFIDKQLDGPYSKQLEAYRTALEKIEKTSAEMFDKAFAELSWKDQTRLLQALERNKVPKEIWGKQSASGFFRMLCDHTMQGYYGSPKHGGNKNYLSYKMMGLEYPRVIGQNRYG